MYILFPGRHHLLTTFQYKYLYWILQNDSVQDIDGNEVDTSEIEGVVFAVTSANHSGTKRNPIPFHLRAMMLQEFGSNLGAPTYVIGIDDVGQLDDFAEYTVKRIAHESDNNLVLTPANCHVVCSTPVLDMYQKNGFSILPGELTHRKSLSYSTQLPWDFIKAIAKENKSLSDVEIIEGVHSSSLKIWNNYQLDQKTRLILGDPIIGSDGDITESRDYNSYVRQMDEIAELKYNDTAPFIKPGNIGDIGCAVGSWIKQACEDVRLTESDFYGIEVTRALYDLCIQRKHNGEFNNPTVFFGMKNAVTSNVFQPASMDTIHTSSLTHEIESYGSRQDLLDFIQNRYDELKPGGVWINRDVVGPEQGEEMVYASFSTQDGTNPPDEEVRNYTSDLAEKLEKLSTRSRFIRFAQDFRKDEGYNLPYEELESGSFKLSSKDCADFMLTKDYTDNWQSEMHETFCFWSFEDWESALRQVGFRIKAGSHDYQNPWIANNRWKGKVKLFADADLQTPHLLPPTNMIMVAEKI